MHGITRKLVDSRPQGGELAHAMAAAGIATPAVWSGPTAPLNVMRLAGEAIALASLCAGPVPPTSDEQTALAKAQDLDASEPTHIARDVSRLTIHSPDHARAATAMLACWQAMAGDDLKSYAEQQDGSVAVRYVSAPEAGLTPVAIGGLVVVGLGLIAGGTVAACWAMDRAAEVADRHLARDARARVAVASYGAAAQVVENHAVREAAAGGPLPFDAAEKTIIERALSDASELSRRKEDPLQPPTSQIDLPVVGAVGIGTLIVIGAAAYLLTRS